MQCWQVSYPPGLAGEAVNTQGTVAYELAPKWENHRMPPQKGIHKEPEKPETSFT